MEKDEKGDSESPPLLQQVVVVMVPLPAQGHLNQLLHLTRIISTQGGIPVHYIGSATHNRQAKDRVQGWDPSTISNIHFHDFQLPQVITPPADPHAWLPIHFLPTFQASIQLDKPLALLLRSLSSTARRVVVIHDSLMAFAAVEASFVSNAEAYCFHSISVYANNRIIETQASGGISGMPHNESSADESELMKFVFDNLKLQHYDAGDIYNTCDAIEGRFLDRAAAAQQQSNKKCWAIGPFNPVAFLVDSAVGGGGGGGRHQCLEWLDKQPPSSVVYVSFGTMISVPDDQIAELAKGLERSQQRFIWVLRDGDRGDIYKEEGRNNRRNGQPLLPNGFEERTEGVGMVVRDWAPQLQILAHPSTGAFVSHCGWNSCMESLSMGVAIAAWPMGGDQPKNAVLVSELLKVGLVVRDWARQEELLSWTSIESSIRKLMASEEGNAIRKRANELGVQVRQSVSEGGTSATQLKSFLAHISR